eukprot:491000-Amphidinium_carterae.1
MVQRLSLASSHEIASDAILVVSLGVTNASAVSKKHNKRMQGRPNQCWRSFDFHGSSTARDEGHVLAAIKKQQRRRTSAIDIRGKLLRTSEEGFKQLHWETMVADLSCTVRTNKH